MQSLVLSQLTGKFPPFTLLNCSGLLWKLLLMSKTIQKLAQTEWRSSTNPYNIYQQKLWFTKSVNYFCIKSCSYWISIMYIYIDKKWFLSSLMHTQVIVSSSGPNKVINVDTAASKIHHSEDVCPLGLFSWVHQLCLEVAMTAASSIFPKSTSST